MTRDGPVPASWVHVGHSAPPALRALLAESAFGPGARLTFSRRLTAAERTLLEEEAWMLHHTNVRLAPDP